MGGMAASLLLAGAHSTHWAAIFTAIGSCVTGGGLVFLALSAKSAAEGVREAQRNRDATMAFQISEKWESWDLREARRAVKKYKTSRELCDAYLEAREANKEEFFQFTAELNFFEDLGVLESMSALSLNMIEKSLKSVIVDRWSTWEVTVKEHRRLARQPTAWENFEGLAHKLAASPPQKKKHWWNRG